METNLSKMLYDSARAWEKDSIGVSIIAHRYYI